MLRIKELDVVLLKDGRAGTVLESYDNGEAFLVEFADEHGQEIEMPIVKLDQIEKITYTA